jgi:hypothetical protein
VDTLRARGYHSVFAPRKRDYDLTWMDGIEKMFADARPEVLFHLAAVVGEIGANRLNPGSFLYENVIIGIQLSGIQLSGIQLSGIQLSGIQLSEAARLHQVDKALEAKEAGVQEPVGGGDGSPTREFLPGISSMGMELIARLCGFAGRLVWDTTQPNGQRRRGPRSVLASGRKPRWRPDCSRRSTGAKKPQVNRRNRRGEGFSAPS